VDRRDLSVHRADPDVHVAGRHAGALGARGPGTGAGTGAEHPAPHRNSTDGPPAGSGAAASAQSPALAQHPPTSFSRTAPGSPELRPSRLNRLTRKSFSPRI